MNSKTELYSGYVEYKDWTGQASFQPENYRALLANAGISNSARLLEIGFGAGTFLDWARAQGHEIEGLEILPEMVSAARARGHQVHLVEDAANLASQLDGVIAIDVLEHLDVAQLRSYFRLIKPLLKPAGLLVARFPNGDSPLVGRYHYGDLTHERPLSSAALAQVAAMEGFRLKRSFNPRSMPPGLARRAKRVATYLVRDLIEIVLGYAYFGYRFPMDPNIAVVLQAIP